MKKEVKLFYDYSTIASKVKYKTSHGKEIKKLTRK